MLEKWQSKLNVNDFWRKRQTLIVRTWDSSKLIGRDFAAQFHISTDAGLTWVKYDVPDGMLDFVSVYDENKIVLITPEKVIQLIFK